MYNQGVKDTGLTRRPCVICGAPVGNSDVRKVCCSDECGRERRRRNFQQKAEQALGEPLLVGITRRLDAGEYMADIARACGLADTRALHRIMAVLGIPRRTSSEATRLQWRDNDARRAATGERFRRWLQAHPETARARSVRANLILQRTSPTSIERRLMKGLDAAAIAYVFQYSVGDKFLCDFGFPDARLIAECDGRYWHSSAKQRARDTSKDAYLRACGYTVLRLSDERIKSDLDGCVHAIRLLTQPTRTRPHRQRVPTI